MPRSEGHLFVGRVDKRSKTRDLEDIFERYGRLTRCEIKHGAEMAYAFVDFEDRQAAEDAVRYENGRNMLGTKIIVEMAKGAPRRSTSDWRDDSRSRGRYRSPPRRRSYSRSRSRSRDRHSRRRRRSRDRSRSPRRRSSSKSPRRSRTPEKNTEKRKAKSVSKSKSKSPSRSRSRSDSSD